MIVRHINLAIKHNTDLPSWIEDNTAPAYDKKEADSIEKCNFIYNQLSQDICGMINTSGSCLF